MASAARVAQVPAAAVAAGEPPFPAASRQAKLNGQANGESATRILEAAMSHGLPEICYKGKKLQYGFKQMTLDLIRSDLATQPEYCGPNGEDNTPSTVTLDKWITKWVAERLKARFFCIYISSSIV